MNAFAFLNVRCVLSITVTLHILFGIINKDWYANKIKQKETKIQYKSCSYH